MNPTLMTVVTIFADMSVPLTVVGPTMLRRDVALADVLGLHVPSRQTSLPSPVWRRVIITSVKAFMMRPISCLIGTGGDLTDRKRMRLRVFSSEGERVLRDIRQFGSMTLSGRIACQA